MYPLVIILGIAAVKKDFGQAIYALPFSIIGIGMSTFHYTLQKTDLFDTSGDGCGLIPCTTEYINWLGFITIPFLALIGFILITIFQILVWRASRT
jgi:disulfide bond formation protein DsbB